MSDLLACSAFFIGRKLLQTIRLAQRKRRLKDKPPIFYRISLYFARSPAHFQVVYHALHHIVIGKFCCVDHQIVVLKILPALSGIVAVIVAALPVDPLNIL